MKRRTHSRRSANAPAGPALRPLVAFSLLSAVALLAILLTGALTHQPLQVLDHRLLLLLRQPVDPSFPIGPDWLHGVGRDITALGSLSILSLVMLLTVSFLLLSDHDDLGMGMAISFLIGALLTFLLKMVLQRPRPELVAFSPAAQTSSLPSGHALMSAVTYLTLGAIVAIIADRRAVRALAIAAGLALTVLVGLSRLYLGVHWPTDVLAGWALGAAWVARIAHALAQRPASPRPTHPFVTTALTKPDPTPQTDQRTEWQTTKAEANVDVDK